jgi:hypothetical protein
MTTEAPVSASSKTRVPDHVLFQTMDGSAAILNLNTEYYFSLDPVGTDIWKALETSDSISETLGKVRQTYDVSAEELTRDVIDLVGQLRGAGLIEVSDA